ncbi:hypothetical protein CYMTET_14011 [Cymbomonas tetramitiformis]|uniref:Selenoprotein O n=1 Tax=Cymbomonas tetramitiformis TaxID=36881 RepID=A0AAE0GGW5_9CHLO|nr:hypothetical protein CYMTET_14011 [Cymbomonas tetramitiformis]
MYGVTGDGSCVCTQPDLRGTSTCAAGSPVAKDLLRWYPTWNLAAQSTRAGPAESGIQRDDKTKAANRDSSEEGSCTFAMAAVETPVAAGPLEGLVIRSSRTAESMPRDTSSSRTPRTVTGATASPAMPTPLRSNPSLLAASLPVLDLLGLRRTEAEREEFAAVFSGCGLLQGMDPVAYAYGGHQFGHWAGQLGDGRAITLGEVVRPNGAAWELQLKGAGRTAFSRGGDGRAVLRSSIREFLASEAMHALGVPTTRSLAIVTSNDDVVRDQFYDGNVEAEKAAVVTRVAPSGSWLRIGTFELQAHRRDLPVLRKLAEHAMELLLPPGTPHQAGELLTWVTRQTAELVARWQAVGFVHGVLNTDNFSIFGITIDYGPFAFLDWYDPAFVPNTSDDESRYAFDQQPQAAHWSLERLLEALQLVDASLDPSHTAAFWPRYTECHLARMLEKLGAHDDRGRDDECAVAAPHTQIASAAVVRGLLEAMAATSADYSRTFVLLAEHPVCNPTSLTATEQQGEDEEGAAVSGDATDALLSALRGVSNVDDATWHAHAGGWQKWLAAYCELLTTLGVPGKERKERMMRVNPRYVLRNHLAHVAIEEAKTGNFTEVQALLRALSQPFMHRAEFSRFEELPPKWAHQRGIRQLSCSS